MASKTREKLIEVARQLFTHKGVAHTTMNDIANASAKGRRTIYTYFKNKREIYNAVLEGESDRMVNALREIARSDAPGEDRLRTFLRVRLDRLMASGKNDSQRAWLKFDGRRLERIQSMAREKESAMLSALLAEGCEKGIFRIDRCRLAKGFIAVATAVNDVSTVSGYMPADPKQSIDDFIEFFLSDISV